MPNRLSRLYLLASRVQAFLFLQSVSLRSQWPLHLHAPHLNMPVNPLTATAADVQAKLTEGSVTSEALFQLYLNQIARHNGYLRAVIATAP